MLSGHFLHDLWLLFFAIFVALGVLMGQGLIIGFGVMGLVAGVVSMAWNRMALEELSYERLLPDRRVFVGEEVPMTVALTNRKPVPLAWVRVDDEVPDALEVVAGDVDSNVHPKVQTIRHSTSLAWYERVLWDYRLRCMRRGEHRLGPAYMESGDPFGFLTSRARAPHQDSILVYPRIVPLEDLGMPASRPLGDHPRGVPIYEDLARPSGLRDYKAGDPLKAVDWKASARMQQLQVRRFEPSSTLLMVLVVAVDTVAPYWSAYSPQKLERVITAASSVANYATERRYTLGLFANDSPVPPGRSMTVPPHRRPDQLSLILEVLATMRPLAPGPMASLLAQHSRTFPMGATLVVTTAFLPPQFVETLRDLKERGHRIVVLYVGDGDCPEVAEGILVYELRDYLVGLEEASERLAG